MPSRRLSRAAVLLAAVLLVAAIPVGRWERAHGAASQRQGIERVRALVGSDLTGLSLTATANVGALECWLYAHGGYAYALELCFDGAGRLVRAVDASGAGKPGYWDVSTTPSSAPFTLPADQRSAARESLDRRATIEWAIFEPYSAGLACDQRVAALLERMTAARRMRLLGSVAAECSRAAERGTQALDLARGLDAPRLERGVRAMLEAIRGELAVVTELRDRPPAGTAAVYGPVRRDHVAANSALRRAWEQLDAERDAVGLVSP